MMDYEKGAHIWVGVDKNIGPDVVVKADGKLLGTAHWLKDFIERGEIEAEIEIKRRRVSA